MQPPWAPKSYPGTTESIYVPSFLSWGTCTLTERHRNHASHYDTAPIYGIHCRSRSRSELACLCLVSMYFRVPSWVCLWSCCKRSSQIRYLFTRLAMASEDRSPKSSHSAFLLRTELFFGSFQMWSSLNWWLTFMRSHSLCSKPAIALSFGRLM